MLDLVNVLVPIVVGGLLASLRAFVKARLTPDTIDTVLRLARVAVSAAEEVGRVAELPSDGKYEYAEKRLRTLSKRVGLRLKEDEANALIHAVLEEARKANLLELLDHLDTTPAEDAA